MEGKTQYKEVKTGKPDASLWDKVKAGAMSTAEYSKKTGMRVLLGGKRHHSKYTMEQLRSFNTIPVKNPKVGANITAMHEKWLAEWRDRSGFKQEPNPNSISSVKLRLGTHRSVAREHVRVMAAQQA